MQNKIGLKTETKQVIPAMLGACTLALLCSCAAKDETSSDQDRVAQALPTASQVEVKVPQSDTIALGQLADYYVVTRKIARDLNGGTGLVLTLVHAIVQYPVTTVQDATYTWGPWSDALNPAEYKLVVTDNGDGSYDWHLDGRKKAEAGEFQSVLIGHAIPSDPIGKGSGNFSMDFELARELDPVGNADNRGQIEIAYDFSVDDPNAESDATIDIHAVGAEGDPPPQFDYHYGVNADGAGNLSFVFTQDIDDEGAALEDVAIVSQWQADGQGRSDGQVSGGDMGDLTVTLIECWNQSFQRTFYQDSQEFRPTEGVQTDCAF